MMKKIIFEWIIIIIMLITCISAFTTQNAEAAVISNNSSNTAVGSPQHFSFYAAGRYWVFYWDWQDDPHYVRYVTSTNGETWSTPVAVTTAYAYGYGTHPEFSLWFDGTNVHYVATLSTSNAPIKYRMGTPNSDGTITWAAAEQNAVGGASGIIYSNVYISVDSNGYPWIGYVQGTFYDWGAPQVTKSQRNDGVWQTASGFPYTLNIDESAGWWVLPSPLTEGKILVVYGYPYNPIKGKSWAGSAWRTEVTLSGSYNLAGGLANFDCVADGDFVHIVFHDNSENLKWYTKYSYETNTATTPVQICAGMDVSNVIVIDPQTKDLYVFGLNQSGNSVVYGKYDAATQTWGSIVTWQDLSEDAESSAGRSVTVPNRPYNGKIGVTFVYTNWSALTLLNIYYMDIGPEGQTNHAPSFDSISVASQSQYANKYFSIVAQVSDEDGVQDITEVRVNFTEFELYYNYNLGSFEVSWDPNGYVTLDELLCDDEITSTTITVTWRLMLNWSFLEGYVSAHGTVWDSSSETGEKSVSNLFYLENDIIVTGASVTDDWVNPGQSITFSAKVYYQGTSIVPQIKTGITGILKKGMETLRTTNIIQSDGSFSFTIFAPAQIGEYEYTLTASIPTGPAASIPDNITIWVDSLVMDDLDIDVLNDTISVRYIYKYDSTPANGLTVKYATVTSITNSSGWATFSLSTISTISYGTPFTVTSGEITYVSDTLANTYSKFYFYSFSIRGDHVISETKWNSGTKTLTFKTTGNVCITTSGFGTPEEILINNTTYNNWQFIKSKDTIYIGDIHSVVTIKWPAQSSSGGSGGGTTPTGDGEETPTPEPTPEPGPGENDKSGQKPFDFWNLVPFGEVSDISSVVLLGLSVIFVVLILSLVARRKR